MGTTYISFFSGVLGLDLGLEQAGFECIAANELDSVAANTIRANRPLLKLYDEDIRNLSLDTFQRDLGVTSGTIDLVAGGPPCQAFSTAGKRRSMDDDRGNLVMHFLSLATGLRPRWIVIENVRGLLSAPLRHRPHCLRGPGHPPLEFDEQPGGALARVLDVLSESGYHASFKLYDAANFGVPQRRERLIIVASRDGEVVPHLGATTAKKDWTTFRQASEGLPRLMEYLPLRQNQLQYVKLLGPGQNWRDLPHDLQQVAIGKAFLSSGGRVGFLRRIAWDAPTPTLVTSPVMPATLLAHPSEDRPLSIEEYKRVQGFPDDWKFFGSTSAKYRQIGNAVPVGLARALGLHLVNYSRGQSNSTKLILDTSRYKNTSEADWRHRYADAVARSKQLSLVG